jgi:hypothetical protein
MEPNFCVIFLSTLLPAACPPLVLEISPSAVRFRVLGFCAAAAMAFPYRALLNILLLLLVLLVLLYAFYRLALSCFAIVVRDCSVLDVVCWCVF